MSMFRTTAPSARSSALRRLRQRVGPWIDRFAEALGRPTTRVYPSGYVATVDAPVGELEARLRDCGFRWDPLSTYHYTQESNSTDGSWAYRDGWLADRQLHVVLFEQPSGRTDVYAHDEFNWLRHPLKHAREVDIRRREGAAALRRRLAASDLEYERHSTPRRRIRHAVERIGASIRARVRAGGAPTR